MSTHHLSFTRSYVTSDTDRAIAAIEELLFSLKVDEITTTLTKLEKELSKRDDQLPKVLSLLGTIGIFKLGRILDELAMKGKLGLTVKKITSKHNGLVYPSGPGIKEEDYPTLGVDVDDEHNLTQYIIKVPNHEHLNIHALDI